jgi:hypothetical protein
MTGSKEAEPSEAACKQRFLETCELSGVSDPHRQTIWEAIESHYSTSECPLQHVMHVEPLVQCLFCASKPEAAAALNTAWVLFLPH